MTRTCSDCPAPITTHSKTGRCRSCALVRQNADPAFQARRVAKLKVTMKTDAYRASHQAGAKRGAVARMADPVMAAKFREMGRTIGANNIHHTTTPEARAKAAKNCQRAHLAWCPEEYWPLNKVLKDARYPLPERKQMIAEEIARAARAAVAAEKQRLAELTPFERQMEWVRNGGKLVAKLDLRKADHSFTLGGVASGMI